MSSDGKEAATSPPTKRRKTEDNLGTNCSSSNSVASVCDCV